MIATPHNCWFCFFKHEHALLLGRLFDRVNLSENPWIPRRCGRITTDNNRLVTMLNNCQWWSMMATVNNNPLDDCFCWSMTFVSQTWGRWAYRYSSLVISGDVNRREKSTGELTRSQTTFLANWCKLLVSVVLTVLLVLNTQHVWLYTI